MLFTIIFKGSYGSIYEGVRIEAESESQAIVNAARMSKYSRICCVTAENGLLEYADSKVIPSSFHCTRISLVELYCNANVKFTTLDIPDRGNNRNTKGEYDEEDFILAMRNILLRKKGGDKMPPNHILIGETYVEVDIVDSYEGWDDNISPFHVLRFK